MGLHVICHPSKKGKLTLIYVNIFQPNYVLTTTKAISAKIIAQNTVAKMTGMYFEIGN